MKERLASSLLQEVVGEVATRILTASESCNDVEAYGSARPWWLDSRLEVGLSKDQRLQTAAWCEAGDFRGLAETALV